MFDVVSIVALVLSLSGNLLVNYKNKWGYIVWIVSNLVWIYVNLSNTEINYSQIIMFLVFIGLNIQGWVNWNKYELKKE